jgi:hypothetical protein
MAFIRFCLFAVCFLTLLGAQTLSVPLTVTAGVLLRLYLTQRAPMRSGSQVNARLIEPIYAFDRVVIRPEPWLREASCNWIRAANWSARRR